MSLKDILSRIAGSEWSLALRPNQGEGRILERGMQSFTLLKNTLRYWCADPFIVESREGSYIFFEAFDRVSRRGFIGCRKVEKGEAGKINIILRESFHLSYPCIYSQGETWYMIPETKDKNRIMRYRASRFPDKWERDITLVDNVKAVDSTVLLGGETDLTLLIYIWESFNKGQLQMINLKPGSEDVSVMASMRDEYGLMRPAGNLFVAEGKLIRPSQICTDRYGEGIVFNEVLCKKDSYDEQEYRRLTAEDIVLSKRIKIKGVHTYNHSDNWEVIDVEIGGISLVRLIDLIPRLYRYIKNRAAERRCCNET